MVAGDWLQGYLYRRECFLYSAQKQSWRLIEEPAPAGLAFSGMGSHGNCVYLVGGRENLYMGDKLDRTWKHSGAVMEYCSTRYAGVLH